MLTCFSGLPKKGELGVPSLFRIGRYVVYFWSNENNEPVHVHIAAGRPVQNATKVWLTAAGGCVLANNNSRIAANELSELHEVIAAQHFLICKAWNEHFRMPVRFYC